VLDLPGAYSLNPTPDEAHHLRRAARARAPTKALPDLIVWWSDATNLRLNLRLVLEVLRMGVRRAGAEHDGPRAKRGHRDRHARLQRELGMPVIKRGGASRGAKPCARSSTARSPPTMQGRPQAASWRSGQRGQ
jgi:ferrous iron transport protein B